MPDHLQIRRISEAVHHFEKLLDQHEIYGVSGHRARLEPARNLFGTGANGSKKVHAAIVEIKVQAFGHDNRKVSHVQNTKPFEDAEDTPEARLHAFIHKLAHETEKEHGKIEHDIQPVIEDNGTKGFRVFFKHKEA